MYTSTPANLPDPPFQFFEGLAPRLLSKLVYSLISKLAYNFNCEDFSEIIKPTYVALRFATRHVTPVYCKMGVAFRVAPYTT